MPVTISQCPLCHSSQSVRFDQRMLHQELITNRLCTHCGLVYQSPRKSDEELNFFYEQEYRTLYQGSQEPTPKDLAVQQGRADHLLSFIRPEISGLNRHLDIGCSAGILLRTVRAEYHNKAVGIEPGNAYRNYAENQGLEVYANLKELNLKLSETPAQLKERFDLVSLAHVLEHIPDPGPYLKNLRIDFLTPQGWLLLEVPNLYGHDCFEIAHLVSFSLHSLDQVLQQAGFNMVKTLIHGKPRSQILPLYITVLARPSIGEVKKSVLILPDKHVKLKRQAAMLKRKLLTRLFPSKAWQK
jgi:2-polyprenyl-3-methyl-5-hydroxy-6-metoxy-1,4-benzoquinol methylase